jgi:hypothetical protein
LAELTNPSLICLEDGQPYLPPGLVAIANGTHFPKGHIVTSLGDLMNTANHPDYRRLNGCCGLDGMDGINTICVEGHEVGTACADCWMSHAIHFDPRNAVLQEYKSPVVASPGWLAWNSGVVAKVANSIRRGRNFHELPILADALEEAGCDNANMLSHCRQSSEHVRGCWVLDLLLGKE